MSEQNGAPLAYPLSWPIHQVRTRYTKASAFGDHTMTEAVALLQAEVRRLGGTKLIISTNIPLRQDGLPRGDYARSTIADKGAAIYFRLKDRDVAFACDKWNRVEHNLYAIAKHIESMRGQQRWGAGTEEQQFRGYAALPDRGGTSGKQWWTVLGFDNPAVATEIIRNQYRTLAKLRHPDAGGTNEQFSELQDAFRQAMQAKGERA